MGRLCIRAPHFFAIFYFLQIVPISVFLYPGGTTLSRRNYVHRKPLVFVHVDGDMYRKASLSIHVVADMCTKLPFSIYVTD